MAGEATSAAAGRGEEGVSLYRAVGQNELADIQIFGGLRPHPGGRSYEWGKLFAMTMHDAARFGRINHRLSGRPFTIIEARVPVRLAAQYNRGVMDRMAVVEVRADQLAAFNAAAHVQALPAIPRGGR